MMLIVPVGAMVTGAEFRIGNEAGPSLYALFSHSGNGPRDSANSQDAR